MSGNILEAVQGFATPAMIAAATSTLGLNEKQASGALGAAVTSILGGAMQKSNDAGVMTQIASLAGAVSPDAGMFSNIAGMLTGGVPSSPIQILGNRLMGQVFGGNQAGAINGLASAVGISGKAASGLMTLAAPMALAAIRTKLGPTPTAASVASLLNQDRNLIAQAMPAPLRAMYGMANVAAPAPGAPTPAAPSAAAPVTAAKPAPVAQTASGHASAAAAAAAPPPAASAMAAAKPTVAATVAPTPAPAAPAPVNPAPAAAAPVVAAPVAPVATPSVAPVKAAAPEPLTREDTEASSVFPLAMIALMLGLLAGSWYWAFGGGREAVFGAPPKPKPVAAATAPAVAPKPAAPTPAATPAPAKPTSPTPLVGQATLSGGLKYALPNGSTIEVAKNGVEQKLIEFVTSSSAIDKGLWFDFDRLGFETGSSDVTAASRAQLDALAAILKSYPATKVKIGGYTDNQGDPAANLKLSDTRAKRVADELVKLGVAA
ncbi:MAG: DUF937 domain-containing protein, partial [Hyphomicrobiaceae bacterium]|nr:DUF937 domain-containing protein [Hyphomicrobiaceae bacterium]